VARLETCTLRASIAVAHVPGGKRLKGEPGRGPPPRSDLHRPAPDGAMSHPDVCVADEGKRRGDAVHLDLLRPPFEARLDVDWELHRCFTARLVKRLLPLRQPPPQQHLVATPPLVSRRRRRLDLQRSTLRGLPSCHRDGLRPTVTGAAAAVAASRGWDATSSDQHAGPQLACGAVPVLPPAVG